MSEDRILDALLEATDRAVIVTDRDHKVLRVNPAFRALTGYGSESVVGRHHRELGSEQHDDTFFESVQQSLEDTGAWNGDMWSRCATGETRLFQTHIRAVRDDAGKVIRYLACFGAGESSTDDRRGHGDPLTGLPNRALFLDRVEQAMINSRRADKSVALLLMGIDRFTLFNEGLGLRFGDNLLKEVARRLKQCVRLSDTVARYGGDQFAVISTITSIDDSVLVAEKVLKSLAEPFDIEGQRVVVGVSIGISLYPTDGDDTEELVEHANSAMRHAKKGGGNQYQFFATQMNAMARNRLELENALRRALENGEFRLYYQPKVQTFTSKVVAAEALIRWEDPERGLIAPGEFIPVAEETGLIVPIGTWVLNEAARQTKAWIDAGLDPIRVAVNVSGRQFQKPDLVDLIKNALAVTGLEARWLELEITESMLMGDAEQTIEKLQSIRDLGLNLSIDDFGTGYSSLSYLSRFPITTLKIDRAFVKDLETNPDTAEIARAIIGLSQGLSLEVVAEGAENESHVRFLKEHGCDMVQGFYYSRPLPADKFEALLRNGAILKR